MALGLDLISSDWFSQTSHLVRAVIASGRFGAVTVAIGEESAMPLFAAAATWCWCGTSFGEMMGKTVVLPFKIILIGSAFHRQELRGLGKQHHRNGVQKFSPGEKHEGSDGESLPPADCVLNLLQAKKRVSIREYKT